MDPLTQTIMLLRPEALLWKQLDATGDWAVHFPPHGGAVFCLVAKGRCVFQAEGRAASVLRKGDFVLMASPPKWTLGRDQYVAPAAFDRIYEHPHSRVTCIGDGKGPVTRILGGRFAFEPTNAALLENFFPSFVEVRAMNAGASRLGRVLDLLGDEASSDRPGRPFVLERLLELMLVEVIRTDFHRVEMGQKRGLLAGLADPQTSSALKALHADVQRSWTVDRLAAVAGMSRSVFAERFSRIVGLPPIDYLLRWRMALAKDVLRQGGESLTCVALRCGYQSVSAFSTAFTRTVGCPPSRFAASAAEAGARPRAENLSVPHREHRQVGRGRQ